MAIRRNFAYNFYPPEGQQEVSQLQHINAGNPVAPDHTLNLSSYPDRRSRSTIFPSNRPMWTTIYKNGDARIPLPARTPNGKVFVSPSASVPMGQDQFMLARRMYIYAGKVVTE